MNISEIPDIATCERRWIRNARVRSKHMHVAAHVGTLAQEELIRLAGFAMAETDAIWDTPVVYDHITRVRPEAIHQAAIIARASWRALRESGWEILNCEVPVGSGTIRGRYDFRLAKGKSFLGLGDLKTGQSVHGAWIQLGGYLSQTQYQICGVIIHAPRTKLDKDQPVAIMERPAVGLVEEFRTWRQRIDVLQGGGVPTPSPGIHCAACKVGNCAVRAADETKGDQ